MTPAVWVLFGHLSGAVCCSTLHDERGQPITYASRDACEAAGAEWLKRLTPRRPNDYFECFERRDGARGASVSETKRREG